ncbi:phytoene desaturase family protein [Corynebacterium liangguodongii]|uniref:phytoene desaturase family protein n=1 Tax=Corynebacterium liangguodongii TaxID=2079535 RepID=UPI001F2239D0|nr:phytoene desaturase family protein [Corynebacterium liangguodongii]
MAERTAIVIGAGVAGLATAALLGREGFRVTVIERLGEVGGRAGEETIDGYRFDTGPSWYLMPEAFDHFFGIFGLRASDVLDLVDLAPAYRIFPEDEEPLDVYSGRDRAIALFDAIEPGAGPTLSAYLDSAAEAYHLAVEHFLYTTFDSPRPFFSRSLRGRYLKLARLLTEGLEGVVEKKFRDRRLRQILTYPAVFLSSHPARTPSLYHLMSHTDLVEGVRYPRRGFSAVVSALASLACENGAEIRLNADVEAITYSGSSATGVRLTDGTWLLADAVVSTADLHFTETRLLPPSKRTFSDLWFAARDPGIGAVLVMLGTDKKLPQLAHHNLLFSRDWEPDFDAVFDSRDGASRSIYVSKPSATDPSTAPAGCENLFVLIPVAAAEGFGHGDLYEDVASPAVASLGDAAIDRIGSWCGIENFRDHITVARTLGPTDFASRYNAWSGGALGPAHTLRGSAFLRGRNASKKLSNLYYAGATTLPGVGVPMCLISAENVIARMGRSR